MTVANEVEEGDVSPGHPESLVSPPRLQRGRHWGGSGSSADHTTLSTSGPDSFLPLPYPGTAGEAGEEDVGPDRLECRMKEKEGRRRAWSAGVRCAYSSVPAPVTVVSWVLCPRRCVPASPSEVDTGFSFTF